MQQYGSAQAQLYLLLSISPGEKVVEQSLTFKSNEKGSSIVTEHDLTVSQISPTNYNVSAALVMEGFVGDFDFTVSLMTLDEDSGVQQSYAADGTHSVYGIVLYETDAAGKKRIVSGDEAAEVTYPSFAEALLPGRELQVSSHAPTGLKLSDMSVRVQALVGGAESKLLSASGVVVKGDKVLLTTSPYRVGRALVTVEHEGLQLRGESFETQLVVAVGATPRPPAVARGGGGDVQADVRHDAGTATFELRMYNVRGLGEVTASAGGTLFRGDVGAARGEAVRFSGAALSAGTYAVELTARATDGGRVPVVALRRVRVRFADAARLQRGGVSGARAGVWAGGVGAMLVAVVAGVAVLAAWRSRRAAAEMESSFASSGLSGRADADVPAPYCVQRDIYGRGSGAGEGQFWRV